MVAYVDLKTENNTDTNVFVSRNDVTLSKMDTDNDEKFSYDTSLIETFKPYSISILGCIL